MRTFTEENPMTADEIFVGVKSRLKNPATEVVTSNDAQVAFNDFCFECIAPHGWYEKNAIEEAIALINDFFDVKVIEFYHG